MSPPRHGNATVDTLGKDDAPWKLKSIAAQPTKNELQLARDDDWVDVRLLSFSEMDLRSHEVRFAPVNRRRQSGRSGFGFWPDLAD